MPRSRILVPIIDRVPSSATYDYGPTDGYAAVIAGVGPRGSIADPGGSRTTLVPANSVAANQALIDGDATGVLWWPKGTYSMISTGYDIPANKVNYLETGPLRTATDTAVLSMSSTSSLTHIPAEIHGANVEWHGGIIQGGYRCMAQSSGGVADNLTVEDAEMAYAGDRCFAVSGGYPDAGAGSAGRNANVVVRYSLFHHGGVLNAWTLGADGWLWEYNEMHHGNEQHLPATRSGSGYPNDEGDCKFLNCADFIYRYNYMHDTDGDLWPDTIDADGVIEENVFINCHRMGIFNEDNDTCTIRRNYFEDNGTDDTTSTSSPQYWQAGAYMGHITIARSQGTDVSYNDFVTTTAVTSGVPHHDIRMHWQALGGTDTEDTYIHHNRFRRTKASAANSGFITHYLTTGNDVAFTTSNNTYDYNEYHVPTGQSGSDWWARVSAAGGGAGQTWTEWQTGGSGSYPGSSAYDPNGTFTADL